MNRRTSSSLDREELSNDQRWLESGAKIGNVIIMNDKNRVARRRGKTFIVYLMAAVFYLSNATFDGQKMIPLDSANRTDSGRNTQAFIFLLHSGNRMH